MLQWDKDDCAAAGLVKFDLLGLGMLTMLHLAVDLVRAQGVDIDLATIPQEDGGLRPLVRGRHRRRVPGGEPGPDGDAAAPAAAQLLRPRGRGRAHPARPDPGWFGASVPAAPQRRGGGHVHPSAHEAVPGEDARRAAVPGAAHAARGRLRGIQRGRSRPAAPGDGLEAQPGAHGADARAAHGGDGRTRHHRRHRGGDLHEAGGVLELRLPREPLGELRLPRLLELVDQVPLPARSSRPRC